MSGEKRERFFIDISCPRCNTKNKYEVFDSIHSDIDLRAKQLLLAEKLFEYKCRSCGYRVDIPYETAYYNNKHNAMIYFVEKSGEPDACAAINETELVINSQWSENVIHCKKRVVDDSIVLREKALIWEQDMDDRVVELVKVVCMNVLRNIDNCISKHALFDIYGDDVCLKVFNSNEGIMTTFPHNLYEHLKNKFSNILTSNKDYIIDESWAINFLSKYDSVSHEFGKQSE